MCLGIPGQIVEILDAQQQRVTAEVEGVRREISVSLLGIAGEDGTVVGGVEGEDPVRVGDWVLIHVGFAMSKIDEAEANETLRALRMFSEAYEQELADFSADGEIDPLAGLLPPLGASSPAPQPGAEPA